MLAIDPASNFEGHTAVIYIIWAVIGILALLGFAYLAKLGITQTIKFMNGIKDALKEATDKLNEKIELIQKTLSEILQFMSTQIEKNEGTKKEIDAIWEDIEKQWDDNKEIKKEIQDYSVRLGNLESEHGVFHDKSTKINSSKNNKSRTARK